MGGPLQAGSNIRRLLGADVVAAVPAGINSQENQ